MNRVRIFTCEACGEGNVCEVTTEGDMRPTKCTMQYIPAWKEAREEGWR